MKTKQKKSLDSLRAFELKQNQLKHLKGGDGIVIEDVVNG